MKRYITACIGIFLAIFVAGKLHSQLVFNQGPQLPYEGKKGDWFFDTKSRLLYHYGRVSWEQPLNERVEAVSVCHGNLIVHETDSLQFLLRADGWPLSWHNSRVECLDKWIFINQTFLHEVLDSSGTLVWRYESLGGNNSLLCLVQGEPALSFCKDEVMLMLQRNFDPDVEWHGWGVLGMSGKWLIEPIYDHPVRFENGLAEVAYYGQRMKINEMGERVDK